MKHDVNVALRLTITLLLGGSLWAASLPTGRQAEPALAQATDPVASYRDDSGAIAALTKAGVPLQRDPSGRVRWIEAVQGELKDEDMRQLPKLKALEWLEIGGGKVTAAGMAQLKGCTALKRLYVHDIYLGDAPLSFLSSLHHLEALSLQRTGVSGKVLRELNTSANLRVLNLSGDEIYDEDMVQIAKLKGLEVLALQDTKVTGAGLPKLAGMTRLNELNLGYCAITDDDLEDFVIMPNLRIVFAEGCSIHEDSIRKLNERQPLLAIFP